MKMNAHHPVKKLLCVVLTGLLTLSALISCTSQTAQTAETTASAETTEVTEAETTRDNLPESDFNGEKFNTLIRREWDYEFDAEQTGDIVNDAVHARNAAVEERFNIELTYTSIAGGWESRESFLTTLSSSILAGDDAFSMVAGYQAYIVTPAMEGLFLNILDMRYIDPEAEWWSQKCKENMVINNRLDLLTGDIALSLWNSIYTMVFNKQLAEEYAVGDLYAIVGDGQWTVDRLYEVSSLVSGDLNGDSVYNEHDLYGFASSNDNHVRVWNVPCDIPIVSRGSDGFMYMSYNTERAQNALEKLVRLYHAQSSYDKFDTFDETYIGWEDSNMFTEGQILIASSYLQTASQLRFMDTDFGILPLPKYDENQEEYLTTVHDSTSMICFPKTVSDPDRSGLIAEALCVESHFEVIPRYYDVSLKTKSSRDTESEAMIDLIRSAVTFDFGCVYTVPLGGAVSFIGTLILNGSTDFASAYAAKESSFDAKLEAINQAFRDR